MNSTLPNTDLPTACCLTPPGRSAIATIRATGVEDFRLFASVFQSHGQLSLETAPIDRVVFGKWNNRQGSSEELVVVKTDEQAFEIHCHGGVAAVDTILQTLADLGFQTISPSPAKNAASWFEEIESAIANARTTQIADQLLSLQKQLPESIRLLCGLMDEDRNAAHQKLDELIGSYQVGKYLTRPIQTAITGSPNVGKSSLVNRILGYQRSIVYDQPGTTRDLVTSSTSIGGWLFEFVDTAGIRDSVEEVEQAGVQLATQKITEADLWVWVIDATKCTDLHDLLVNPDSITDVFKMEIESIADRRPDIVVLNKWDLVDSSLNDATISIRDGLVVTSAVKPLGIEELVETILQKSIGQPLNDNEQVTLDSFPTKLFTERQLDLVVKARKQLDDNDIKSAQESLKQIILSSFELS